MAHKAVKDGDEKYSKVHFMIRSRLYKGLIDGTMNIGELIDDDKVKIETSNRCCYCGLESKLTIDHLIPQSKGGKHIADNSVWCCQSCNSSKGNKDLLEWYQTKEQFPPLMLLRRYLKLVIGICSEFQLMDQSVDLMNRLPFNVQLIPTNYPLPIQLILI